MNNIEVEVRSFISKEKYDELFDFFKKNADFVNEDSQETHYFDSKDDIRIQKNKKSAKVWMKKGNIHDNFREEKEIIFEKNDFEVLEKIFISLGLKVKIKWFRKRYVFNWDNIKVCLDNTKGYGYILELEIMSNNSEKEKALVILNNKMSELKISTTTKEEFSEKFKYYEENWKDLI